jgi:hypothetical protein
MTTGTALGLEGRREKLGEQDEAGESRR